MLKFFEFKKESDFEPIKSFYLQDELNPKVWETEDKVNQEIREELLQIAEDFLEQLEIGDIDIDDIVLTGSLANFNWSDYSDFDLHIIFDFTQVNDDEEFASKYFRTAGRLWNDQHDILISGYEVELYCQNSSEKHTSSGVYSLKNDEWVDKPSKESFEPDEELIRKKAEVVMDAVDEVDEEYQHDYNYEKLSEKVSKIFKKLKENRQKGLDKEGEFSTENLVFKLLRRNKYIERLLDLKSSIYDKQFLK